MEIHIGDRVAEIELVSKEDNKVVLTIDGKPFEADVVMAENGTCNILMDGRSANAQLIRRENGKSYKVNTHYSSFNVEIVDSQAKYLRMRKKETASRGSVSVRANDGGEDRILQVESSLNVDIKVYEDVEADLLKDMFSYSAQVDPVRSRFSYENLLMRNNAKTRVVKKERLKSSQPSILQIVNVTGSVDIDDVRPADDAVVVEGAVKAAVLYVSSDDSRPLCQMEVVAPFSYRVETVPLRTQDSIRITPALNQITAALPGNDEVEIKAIVDMGMTIFTRKEIELIDDMTVAPVDMKKKAVAPGIVGYVVRDGDSIWSIAKQYYSSLDSIRKLNRLEGDDVKAGDRLIVVKCAGKN